jgi:hypothetical protein
LRRAGITHSFLSHPILFDILRKAPFMNTRTVSRRSMLASAVPTAAALATATAAVGASSPPRPTGGACTVPAAAFRPLLASRRDAIRRRLEAEARLNAAPQDLATLLQLEQAFGDADSRLLGIERHLLDLTLRAVGHGSVRVDDVVLTVATRAGNVDDAWISVVDLAGVAITI